MWNVWIAFAVIFVSIRWLLVSRWLPGTMAAKGKAVLVTGAASGIGKSTARRLMRMGCHVYAADLSVAAVTAALQDVVSDGSFTALSCNVTDPEAVTRVAAAVRDGSRGLWGVVNSAGISHAPIDIKNPTHIQSGLEKGVNESYQPVMDVNFFGTVRVNQAVFPFIMESQGCVVNIASVAGHVGLPGLAPYCASKFAVLGYSDAVRRELAPYGVSVCTVCPGFVQTPMVNNISMAAADPTQKFDYSHTLLKRGRGDEGLMKSLSGATLTTGDNVAATITQALFAVPAPGRVFSDLWHKALIWQFFTAMPMAFQDGMMQLLERAYGESRSAAASATPS